MIVEEDVYDYLEHFGVKGMRWGVRTSATTGKSRKPVTPSKQLTPQARAARNRKRAIIGGGVLAIGAIAALRYLDKSGGKSMPSITMTGGTSKSQLFGASYLKANGSVKIKDIPKPKATTFREAFVAGPSGTTARNRTVVTKKRILAS